MDSSPANGSARGQRLSNQAGHSAPANAPADIPFDEIDDEAVYDVRPESAPPVPARPESRPPVPTVIDDDADLSPIRAGVPLPWLARPGRRVGTTVGRQRAHSGPPTAPRPTAGDAAADMEAAVVGALSPGTRGTRVVRIAQPDDATTTPRGKPSSFIHLRPLVATETWSRRLLFALLALLVAAMSYFVAATFVVPGEPITLGGSTPTPAMRWLGSTLDRLVPSEGLAHIGPTAAALAAFGVFFLARVAGGSFLGVLAVLVFVGQPAWIEVATASDGAAVTVATAVWAMVALLAWWRTGDSLLGVVAGLLAGSAVVLAPGSFALLVPLVVVCLSAWTWRRPLLGTLRALIPLAAAVVPVGLLLATHYRQTGSWSEPTLMAIVEMVRDVTVPALEVPLLIAAGVVGLLAMIARRPRLGLVMSTWLAGAMALAPVSLVLAAPALVGAAYALWRVLYAPSGVDYRVSRAPEPKVAVAWRQAATALAAGVIVAVMVVDVRRSVGEQRLVRHVERLNDVALIELVRQVVPPETPLLIDPPGRLRSGRGLIDQLREAGQNVHPVPAGGDAEAWSIGPSADETYLLTTGLGWRMFATRTLPGVPGLSTSSAEVVATFRGLSAHEAGLPDGGESTRTPFEWRLIRLSSPAAQ